MARPGPVMKVVYRAPLVAYRLGLAGGEHWIGMHWLALTTRGRKSGREHTVLLDLIGEDRQRRRYYVQAAYGRDADWVRNAEARGTIDAQVGIERFTARLEMEAADEARAVMLASV